MKQCFQFFEKAEYGSDLLNRLSQDLTERYGKGFGRSNIYYMRKLFLLSENADAYMSVPT